MSSPKTFAAFLDRDQIWYFGIPWTIPQMKRALAEAELSGTTDPYELQLRQDAEAELAEANQPGAPDLFEWVSESVGAIINKSPNAFTTMLCKDPSKTYSDSVDVLVLRKKIGTSESDLEASPDLLEKRAPTDAQAEELKRRGWDVNWYRAAEQ